MKRKRKPMIRPLPKSERNEIQIRLRHALYRRGWRQTAMNEFERTDARGTYRVLITAVSVEKEILRCMWERKPGTNRAWKKPGWTKFPYWWEELSRAWFSELTIDADNIIHGLRKY